MKYKSCHLLEHGIYFYYDSIQVCCFLTGKGGKSFHLNPDYKGEQINWEQLIEQKKQLRENHRKGIIHPNCEGCFNLEEKEWDSEDYINTIYISHWTKCNCNCTYCYTEENKKIFNTHKNYKLMPILKEMEAKGILKFDQHGYFAFGGGEPAVLNEFDKIFNYLAKNKPRQMYVNSSGIKFIDCVAKGLKNDNIELTVSIDAGSREVYKKIKKIDAYDKVLKHLKKYVSKQGNCKDKVRSKYIIIPDVNDSKEEIEKWLQDSVKIGIKHVVVDIEGQWFLKNRENMPQNAYDLIEYVENRTKELNLGLFYFSYADQLRHERDKTIVK